MWFYEISDKYAREFLICNHKNFVAKLCASREKTTRMSKAKKKFCNSIGLRILD